MSPKRFTNFAAVFQPTPSIPLMLSDVSPASASTSRTLSGVTSNFAATSSGPKNASVLTLWSLTPGSTNCNRSLSQPAIVTSNGTGSVRAQRTAVAMMSSASNPGEDRTQNASAMSRSTTRCTCPIAAGSFGGRFAL